jgi:tetratricopeptide (TPR) repeat protein
MTAQSNDQQVITLAEGLTKKIIRNGWGEIPTGDNCIAYVHYVGTLENGTKFDSSRDRNEVFQFELGQGKVIKGWDVGVSSMKIGEIAELVCSPDYAYGKFGSPPSIPGDATLTFEVELIDFEVEPTTPEEKIEASKKKKENGNSYFKQGDFRKAEDLYRQGLRYISEEKIINKDNKSAVIDSRIVLNLNIAACQLKNGDYYGCSTTCQKVLNVDANVVKALFRLGQAHHLMGNFEQAKEILNKALAISSDEGIKRELSEVQRSQSKFQQKQAQLFGNNLNKMFE